ncbi:MULTISPECIES: twin-arginine translocase subunit TatC [Halorussus]|uniref:twin-arginine translocase subunit TatC n=1 Tax=Halorussus TaxID=1070314 RepID=UPI00209DB05B|nr:twin-arginine translocase subunit TatC [Halorussus vallis]USZ73883.1 twin-arginine translocase subunit TatC [Halorussus vallis]
MSGGSSIVDEDTARAVNSGRETVGAMLSTAQDHLRKVFVVFLVGFLASFYALRGVGWPFLKKVTTAQMTASLAADVKFVAVTPFDVILLQAKIGAIAGIILALPVLLYYARDSFRQRSWYPRGKIAGWKLALIGLLALVLFFAGILYGYAVFFPLMFQFLADNAISAGFETRYSIVKWTEFIAFLSLSFGLAAELPLAMSGLAYTGIVPYETFRDKWRYAVLGIFVFGAVASPPDPFTQVMWAAPLVMLYAFSLYLTKIIVTLKRGSERLSFLGVIRDNWIRVLGTPALAFLAARLFLTRVGVAGINAQIPTEYAKYRLSPLGQLLGLPETQAVLAVSGAVAAVAFVAAFIYYLTKELDKVAATAAPAGAGTAPANIDLSTLDAGAVRAAPPEVFVEMDEATAVDHARQAMDDDEPEKAQAILDRYDELHPEEDEDAEAAAETAAGAAADGTDAASDDAEGEGATFPRESDQAPEGSGNVFQSTAAGMADAFTEDETTEDDIGGWFYDLRFIFESLTSKMMYLVGVFMAVLALTFAFLYRGGIGEIREDFLSRLPAAVRPEMGADQQVLGIVTLHPVEALVFEVKISTLLAAVAVLPLLLYWSWPAMKERGIASGDRRVFGVWAGAITIGLIAGSALGYTVVAPNIISWLVADALRADMIISYRVSNFFWLVFFTTAGIGLLADVPVTMLLFERGGIVSFDAMKSRWREVTIAVFAISGLVTPDSLYTMFLLAVPISLAYGVGLGLLWVVTLGGRR